MNENNLEEMKEQLEKMKQQLKHYEALKKKRNQNYYNFRERNIDMMREQARIRSKKYYDDRKNDPSFMKKQLEKTKKSIEKRKLAETVI